MVRPASFSARNEQMSPGSAPRSNADFNAGQPVSGPAKEEMAVSCSYGQCLGAIQRLQRSTLRRSFRLSFRVAHILMSRPTIGLIIPLLSKIRI